jgi:S-DNA-T family DNA segregation ATPase FtsK/SpoIIIE
MTAGPMNGESTEMRDVEPDGLADHMVDDIDVDGDGVPDLITPAPRPAPRTHPALPPAAHDPECATDVAVPDYGTPDYGTPDDDVPRVRASVRDEDLRPIVPPWMRSRQGWRAGTRWWLGVHWYRARFHLFRLPAYTARVAWRAPRGLLRVVVFLTRWALDTRADALEQALATGTKQDSEEFRRLREDRAFRIRSRLIVLAVAAVATLVGGVIGQRTAPGWAQAAAVAVVLAVLAKAGSDRGRPLVAPAMLISAPFRELTDVVLMRALRASGLGGSPAKFDRNGVEVEEDTRATLAGLIARTANQKGSEAVVDLPFGKTAADAAGALDKLASGLDTGSENVFVEPLPGRTRRVRIIVMDEDPMRAAPHRSPLAKLPRVSVWDEHPFARTPLDVDVRTSLLFRSVLLGAVPRSGKSFAAKCLVAPALLDPHCDVTVIDLKGGRDWRAAAGLAVNYVAGDDDEDLLAALAVLLQVQAEARSRFNAFGELDTEQMPEDKLTRELAEAGMRPHVVVVDEVQNLLRATDKTIRAEALAVLTWLAKSAPAAGVTLVAITQRPSGDVIPPDLREQFTVRVALRTKTRHGSDSILGTDISATGYRSDRFTEHHKGACVIGGVPTAAGGDLQVARTDLFTPDDFTRACEVGRQRRVEAGTLRGLAAGDVQDVTVTVTIVEDVAAVWPGDRAKVWSEDIVDRLRQVFGPRYAALDETRLARALKPHGVQPGQVKLAGTNKQGYALADVHRAQRALAASRDGG